ncbi:hypothetical protein [Ruminococcus sp.]|uniref:hypothetical protein n=1 Tax=Ruminococcus sp. TaxID=41978 RepID=UPI001B2CE7AF|nr:hypothetical protein [Ruminococcus sp.]MBO5558184.1 hypothetical protein [Ruminococcus sp.]
MSIEKTTVKGGWTITQGDTSIEKHPDALAAFEKATAGFIGVKFTPVALLATQIVSGKNYAILCKATPATLDPATTLKVVIVYEDLNGNATITGIKDVLGADYPVFAATCDCSANDNIVLGGWNITLGDPSIDKHPDALAAIEKATAGMLGAKYEPIALLGTQIVAGKNYCILCRITPVTLDPKPTMKLVYVYEDTEGNAVITEIKEIIGAPVPGGFIANDGATDLNSNPEVKNAFEKATKDLLGVDYEPIAYLGYQIVAGKNYLILCESKIVVPDPIPSLTLVTVYEDLDGNCKIINTEPVVL